MLAGACEHAGDGALKDDVAAAAAGLGADFDDVIGGANHGLVVFDDDDGVAGVGERTDDRDEPVDVARVQADAGLIEDEERVDERGAEAAREVDALHLAAGERFRRAVEREIAEADLLEVAQAGDDRVVGQLRLMIAGLGPGVAERDEEIGDGELVELGQGAAVPFPAERLGLEALAAAVGAGIVGAVAREEDAHVHLVGVLLEPAEESPSRHTNISATACRSPRRSRARRR